MKKQSIVDRYTIELSEDKIVERAREERSHRTKDADSGLFYLGFIGEIGFTIALPIAGGAFLGTYLDRHWGTYPKATLSLLFFGIVVSTVTIVRIVSDVLRRSRGSRAKDR